MARAVAVNAILSLGRADTAAMRVKVLMAHERTARAGGLLLLLILSYFLFFHRLGDRGLWSSHEARAAQDAQSIVLDRAWGLPRLFDRKVELRKPPLYYWLVPATAQLRGGMVDAWSVRLPAAVAGLGIVVFLYLLGIRRGRALGGFFAAAMLATALHYTWLGRTGRIDMVLALAESVALGCFYMGLRCLVEQHGRRAWHWLFIAYIAAAVGVLLKGPIGLILPAAVGFTYLLIKGELPSPQKPRDWLRLVHSLGLWWGLPLVLAIALPWYVFSGSTISSVG